MYNVKKSVIKIDSKKLEKMSTDPTIPIINIIQKLSKIRCFTFKDENNLNKFVIDKFYDKLFLGNMFEDSVKSELTKVSLTPL